MADRPGLLAYLASRIDGLSPGHPVRVAIDGVDAAGKTVLADELAKHLSSRGRPVIRASIDGFHNPAHVRRRRGDLSPEGYYRDSFDYTRLTGALLRPLGPGGDRLYRRAIFDFRNDSPIDSEPLEAPPSAILLFDGVFLLRPELRDHWDFSIFVRADFSVTLTRALERDLRLFGTAEAVRERYTARYVPGQRVYIAEVEPESLATIVIDNNDVDRPFLVSPI